MQSEIPNDPSPAHEGHYNPLHQQTVPPVYGIILHSGAKEKEIQASFLCQSH
jgi:hypothetical protein